MGDLESVRELEYVGHIEAEGNLRAVRDSEGVGDTSDVEGAGYTGQGVHSIWGSTHFEFVDAVGCG